MTNCFSCHDISTPLTPLGASPYPVTLLIVAVVLALLPFAMCRAPRPAS
jgi:hypothetical protein